MRQIGEKCGTFIQIKKMSSMIEEYFQLTMPNFFNNKIAEITKKKSYSIIEILEMEKQMYDLFSSKVDLNVYLKSLFEVLKTNPILILIRKKKQQTLQQNQQVLLLGIFQLIIVSRLQWQEQIVEREEKIIEQINNILLKYLYEDVKQTFKDYYQIILKAINFRYVGQRFVSIMKNVFNSIFTNSDYYFKQLLFHSKIEDKRQIAIQEKNQSTTNETKDENFQREKLLSQGYNKATRSKCTPKMVRQDIATPISMQRSCGSKGTNSKSTQNESDEVMMKFNKFMGLAKSCQSTKISKGRTLHFAHPMKFKTANKNQRFKYSYFDL